MRGFVAITVMTIAACGGRSTLPRGGDHVRLVSCQPALPTPSLSTVVPVTRRDTFESIGNGWDSQPAEQYAQGPAMAVGRVTSDDPIDTVRAEQIVGTRLAQIEACFSAPLPSGMMLKVASAWMLRIGTQGDVTKVLGAQGMLDAQTNVCVSDLLKGLTFPKPTAGTAMLRVPLIFDSTGKPTPLSPGPTPVQHLGKAPSEPWTPFANQYALVEGALAVAQATEAALRGKRAELDACFAKHDTTGSLRAILELDATGTLLEASAGGLGDRPIEYCVEQVLGTISVTAPTAATTEIACDFSRGDAQPWHVSLKGGYDVVRVSTTELAHAGTGLRPTGMDPTPLDSNQLALVVLDPKASGAMILFALAYVSHLPSAMFAVQTSEPAPRYLAMGLTATSTTSLLGDAQAVFPIVRVAGKTITACVGRIAETSPLASASSLVKKVAEACKAKHCADTLVLTVDGDAVTRDLFEVAGAIRRAGFERVLLSPELACRAP